MTKAEVNQIMGLIQANWPSAFKNLGTAQKKLVFSTWFFGLQDIPGEAAVIAVIKLAATSKWPPTLSEIRDKVRNMYYEAAYGDGIADIIDSMGLQERKEEVRKRRAWSNHIAQMCEQVRGDGANEPPISAFFDNADLLAIESKNAGGGFLESAPKE